MLIPIVASTPEPELQGPGKVAQQPAPLQLEGTVNAQVDLLSSTSQAGPHGRVLDFCTQAPAGFLSEHLLATRSTANLHTQSEPLVCWAPYSVN